MLALATYAVVHCEIRAWRWTRSLFGLDVKGWGEWEGGGDTSWTAFIVQAGRSAAARLLGCIWWLCLMLTTAPNLATGQSAPSSSLLIGSGSRCSQTGSGVIGRGPSARLLLLPSPNQNVTHPNLRRFSRKSVQRCEALSTLTLHTPMWRLWRTCTCVHTPAQIHRPPHYLQVLVGVYMNFSGPFTVGLSQ